MGKAQLPCLVQCRALLQKLRWSPTGAGNTPHPPKGIATTSTHVTFT